MKRMAILLLLGLTMLALGIITISTIVLIPVGLIAVFAGCIMLIDTIQLMTQ